ncbi:hypothetical protein ACLMJK_003730 [Lecanora helva]
MNSDASLILMEKNMSRVDDVDVALRNAVHSRRIFKIESPYRAPTTEFWSVLPNKTEKEKLKTVLDADDVSSPLLRLNFQQKLVEIFGNIEIAKAQGSQSLNLSVLPSPLGRISLASNTTVTSDPSIQMQKSASWNLQVVSWAPAVRFIGRLKGYAYKWNQPRQTTIYIIDNGLDPLVSEDFLQPFRGVTWYFPPWARKTKTDEDPDWHGSCVSSLAAGLEHGVSKESKILMFKSSQRLGDILWAFSTIRDTFKSGSREGQKGSVILFTASARSSSETLPYWIRIKDIIQELFQAGAIVVVPAGNYVEGKAQSRQIDTIPALWSNETFPLVVVGAVNHLRWRAPFSQEPKGVTVYAPGENVRCAHHDPSWYDLHLDAGVSGTSYAAAMVAGLLAYYLSFQEPPFVVGNRGTAQAAVEYLKHRNSSWSRTNDDVNVLWNGLDGSNKSYVNEA